METQTEAVSQSNGILKVLSHPITGFAVGIIGVILAIYFYYAARTEPKLILLLHPVRSPIVQAGKLSELTVLFNGKPIQGDLTAAQFIIWNSGKAPVRHEDILKPIVLMTASNHPIYEATIRHVSRDVVGFQVATNHLAEGKLGFDWKVMEHNDGASIQILYGGDQKLPFLDNDAAVIGQRRIPFQYLNVDSKSLIQRIGANVLFGFLAFGTMAAFRENIKKARKCTREKNKKGFWDAIFWAVICCIGAVMFCLAIFTSFVSNNAPPFDF